MRNRPITTLFMLMSVDGKISTGASDKLDADSDLPNIRGACEGLHQYYDIQETTDNWSLNSGRVQAKIGANERPRPREHWDVNFVIIDNKHLDAHGVDYFIHLAKQFVLVTTNPWHPAFDRSAANMQILYYDRLDPARLLEDLAEQFGCERLTIQSGGTLNGLFLREKLLDFVDIVVAPVLVGGRDTSTLIDGESLISPDELFKLGVLQLESAQTLENSYVRLRYKVIG